MVYYATSVSHGMNIVNVVIYARYDISQERKIASTEPGAADGPLPTKIIQIAGSK